MLKLSGKIGDQFFINDDIVVCIAKNANGVVQLGFEAPKKHVIHRKTVYDKIKNEGSLAQRGKVKTEDN
jgi:carbon storage regulator CsrA